MPSSTKSQYNRRALLTNGARLSAGVALSPWLVSFLSAPAQAKLLPNNNPKAIVDTTGGKVRGLIADGVHIFRGIPYGASTDGNARFLPPTAAKPWSGVRDTLHYGDRCVQQQVGLDRIVTGGESTRETSDLIPVWPSAQSENCLNLNVWTPAVNGIGEHNSGKRPVMVWLHPGGFEYGSANLAFNDGTNLARRGDVVVVAINHRLGALGYLHLGELVDNEFSRAGNAGMLDIVLALQWVRDNIEAFGGDPERVMIHGESGGGRKVSTALAMPGAKGLFQRAAIQSGPGLRFPSSESQTRRTHYLLKELGLSNLNIQKLQQLPAQQFIAAATIASAKVRSEIPADAPFYELYGYAPVIGPDLPQWPFDPSAPSVSADVPVMIGSNRHEMSLAFTQDKKFDRVNEQQLLEQANSLIGDDASSLVRIYRDSYPDANERELMLLITADHSHRMDSIKLAERKTAQDRGPVYMYRFDWESPVLDGLIMAAHTYEIPHVFDNAQLCSGMTGGGPDAVALAAKMSAAWVAFAHNGNPNTDELPQWSSYNTNQRATMLFNDVCKVVNDPGSAERKAWREIEKQRAG